MGVYAAAGSSCSSGATEPSHVLQAMGFPRARSLASIRLSLGHGSTDGEIFTNIKDGIGPKFDMKPMKAKMMDPDIWNVVNYVRSLGPKSKTK